MSEMRKNQYFVPGEGIARAVIQADICKYLDNDATVRPGDFNGVQGYFIFAYRNLTDAMLEDLKHDSARWRAEQEEKDRTRTRKDNRNTRNLPPNTYENSNVHARRHNKPDYPIDFEEPSPFGGPIDVQMGNSGNPREYQRQSPYSGSDQGQYTTQSSQPARFTPPQPTSYQAPYDSYSPNMQTSNMAPNDMAVPRYQTDYNPGVNNFGNFGNNQPNGFDLGNAPNQFSNQHAHQPPPPLPAGGNRNFAQPPPPPGPQSAPPAQRDKSYGSGYEGPPPNARQDSFKKPRIEGPSSNTSRPDYSRPSGSGNGRFR